MTITRSLGMAALVWATQVGAIQIGNLETQSGLNEPLRARVLVSEMSEADARTLDVRVADDATYTRLGLVRAAAVEGLEFALNPTESGSWTVDIVGQRAVRDPFIVLLLDVRSASGRALREFTVLLDPGPVRNAGEILAAPLPGAEEVDADIPAPQVSVAAATAAPADAVPAPAVRRGGGVIGNEPVVGREDYLYSKQPASPADVSTVAYRDGGSAYGPVRRGESLSSVAKGIAQSRGAHVAQVMWALYAANPAAFDGSINNLRVGAQLAIPATADITATSVARARINIRDAVNDASATASTVAPQPQSASQAPAAVSSRERARETPTVSTPEVLAETAPLASRKPRPVADRAPNASAMDSTMPGASPIASTAAAATPRSEDLFDEPAETLVTDTSDVAAGDEFDAGEVGEDFVEEGSAVVLEDTEEAPVENTGAAEGPGAADAVLRLLKTWLLPVLGAVLVGVLLLFALAAVRRNKRRREEELRAEQEAATRPRPDLVGMARGEPIMDPTEALPVVSAAAAGVAGGVAASAAKASEDEDSPTLSFDTAPLADLSSDSDAPPSAGAQLDAALEEFDNDFETSDGLDDPAASQADDEDAAFAALLQSDDTNDGAGPETAASSDLGEFDIDFGEPPPADEASSSAAEPAGEPKSMFATASFPLVTDEKTEAASSVTDDPVGEAEFQLAYGLYDEAEQTLKAVLEAEPGRLDAMEKLAEVYFAAGRQDEFEKLAMELKRDQGMTQEFRNVEALAQQLIPSSKLFDSAADSASDASTDGEVAAEESPPARENFDTVAFDIPEFNDEVSEPVAEAVAEEQGASPVDDDHVVDFDLSDDDGSVEDIPAETVGQAAEESAPDLELDPVADLAAESTQAQSAEVADEPDFAATVAFNIPEIASPADSLTEAAVEPQETPPSTPPDEAPTESADDNLMEFSLDDFGADDLGEVGGSDDFALDLDDTDDDALNLDGLAEGLELDDATAPSTESTPAAESTPEAELVGDEELAFAPDAEPSVSDADDAFSLESVDDDALNLEAFDDGISDGGDLNSKLDLARGYVDMGEIDMARSLLDEVATRGDADQQTEARKMLESLA